EVAGVPGVAVLDDERVGQHGPADTVGRNAAAEARDLTLLLHHQQRARLPAFGPAGAGCVELRARDVAYPGGLAAPRGRGGRIDEPLVEAVVDGLRQLQRGFFLPVNGVARLVIVRVGPALVDSAVAEDHAVGPLERPDDLRLLGHDADAIGRA